MSKTLSNLRALLYARYMLVLDHGDSQISYKIRISAVDALMMRAYELGLDDGRKALDNQPPV